MTRHSSAWAEGDPPTSHELAARCGFSVDQMRGLLEILEGQSSPRRVGLFRRFVEAWLVQQRELHDPRERGE